MRVRLPPGAFCGGAAPLEKGVAGTSYRRVGKFGNPRAPEARDRRFNPATPTRHQAKAKCTFRHGGENTMPLRWCSCWYGLAAVNRSCRRFDSCHRSLNKNQNRALGRAAKAPAFQAGEAGSTPAGHFVHGIAVERARGSANGRPPAFEAGDEGSNPSPRTILTDGRSLIRGQNTLRGSCCW